MADEQVPVVDTEIRNKVAYDILIEPLYLMGPSLRWKRGEREQREQRRPEGSTGRYFPVIVPVGSFSISAFTLQTTNSV